MLYKCAEMTAQLCWCRVDYHLWVQQEGADALGYQIGVKMSVSACAIMYCEQIHGIASFNGCILCLEILHFAS